MIKLFLKKNGIHILEAAIIVLCILAVIPAFAMVKYNIPGASDDFFHGFFLNDKPYWEAVVYWYKSGYNGRFANALIMQLPGRPFLEPSFGQTFPYITFILLYISQTYLIRTITKNQSLLRSIMLSSLLFVFFIGYCPHIQQYYWFSGLTVYVMPAIFYFTLLAIFIRRFNQKQNVFTIAFTILALFFIVGSNENWMIMSVLTVFTFFALSLKNKEKLTFFTYFTIAYLIALSIMVVFSPGTTHRLEGEGQNVQNQDLVASASTAAFHVGRFIKDWFFKSWFLLGSVVVGMLLYSKKGNTNTQRKLPIWYSSTLSILIIYIGIFIMFYSLGYKSHLRVRGLLPVYFVASILLAYTGILIGQSKVLKRTRTALGKYGIHVLLSIILVISISNSFNFKNLVHEINTGSAERLSKQNEYVIDLIQNSESDTVYVPNITGKSQILYSLEIPKKPEGLTHWILRTYFNKKVIIQDNTKNIDQEIQKQEKE